MRAAIFRAAGEAVTERFANRLTAIGDHFPDFAEGGAEGSGSAAHGLVVVSERGQHASVRQHAVPRTFPQEYGIGALASDTR